MNKKPEKPEIQINVVKLSEGYNYTIKNPKKFSPLKKLTAVSIQKINTSRAFVLFKSLEERLGTNLPKFGDLRKFRVTGGEPRLAVGQVGGEVEANLSVGEDQEPGAPVRQEQLDRAVVQLSENDQR